MFLPELGIGVHAVPYAVTEAGDRWLADIEINPPGASYSPFIQLAVARYQPESLRNLELSTVVTTDMVPLLPDRRLVISRVGGGARVELTGTMPVPPSALEVIVEHCVTPPAVPVDAVDLIDPDGQFDGVPAWRTVGERTVDRGPTDIPLPAGLGPLRLRIRGIDFLQHPLHRHRPPTRRLGRRLTPRRMTCH